MRVNKNIIFSMEDFEKAREYWLAQLTGELEEVRIPYDFEAGHDGDPETGVFATSIPAETGAKISNMTKGQDILLYVFLLAGLDILLYRYSGQNDILVAGPIYSTSGEQYDFNHAVVFKESIEHGLPVKGLLKKVKQTVIDGYKNQHYSLDKILVHLGLERSGKSLSRFLVMLENIHSPAHAASILQSEANDFAFSFMRTPGGINCQVHYKMGRFRIESVKRYFQHYMTVLAQMVENLERPVGEIMVFSPEERRDLLFTFNDSAGDYPLVVPIHQLFEEKVDQGRERCAVVFEGQTLTYQQLDERANRLARYLVAKAGVGPDRPVGILMDRCFFLCEAIWGVLKAGGVYVPIEPSQPENMIRRIIQDTGMSVIISLKRYIRSLNRLMWECTGFDTFICLDSHDIMVEDESEKSGLMDRKLWEYIGKKANDDISGGGWRNSFNGELFSIEEMNEYGDNVLKKLSPYLHEGMEVLEIGCASGLTMYRVAPRVGYYLGTDISGVIIDKNQERVEREGYSNIELKRLAAEEIDQVTGKHFDLIIINSVIQGFHGHNYLVKIIKKAIALLKSWGYLFIGDIMDHGKKRIFARELEEYKKSHREELKQSHFRIDTELSQELFVARGFFEDLVLDIREISQVEITDKIYTIANELTKYRYDIMITIDKNRVMPKTVKSRLKHRHDLEMLKHFPVERMRTEMTMDHLVYIIYTSGTTGNPKGVLVAHRNLANFVHWRISACGYTPDDVTLQLMSVAFDAFGGNFFPAFLSGGKVVIISDERLSDYDYIRNMIKEEKVTNFSVLPSMYQLILEGSRSEILKSIRFVILGGEKADDELLQVGRQLLPHVITINEYGPTENTITTTANFSLSSGHNSIIGKPILNNRVYILDKRNEPLPIGITGELCVSGVGVSRGYLNRPELTGEKFIPSPFDPHADIIYKTGDLACWLPDGHIRLLGRVDEQVKIRGFRIEPGEIETYLLVHEDIKNAVVVTRVDGDGDKHLCVYWVPKTSSVSLEAQDIKEYLHLYLPDYKIPHYFIKMERFPLTLAGKVDKKSLPEPQVEADARYVPPRDWTERQLVSIWTELLALPAERVGIDSDFFQLGGHSLKATLLILKIKKEFDVRVPLDMVFSSPTIRELASFIRGVEKERFSSIPAVEERDYYPLALAQQGLFVHQSRHQDSTAYNEFLVVRIRGNFSAQRLEQVTRKMIRRHESLRTAFILVNGQPVMRIVAEDRVHFSIEEHLATSSGMVETLVRGFIRPFDLGQPPLLRVGLLQVSDREYILMVDMHHIITDGVSQNLFFNEFVTLYQGMEPGPLALRYRDYTVWMNSPAMLRKIEDQKSYWIELFKGELPLLKMPGDFERPAIKSYKGAFHEFAIDQDLNRGLKQLALETETTLYMVLLAGYYVLLWTYSGQEDIVVGSPVTGRNHVELQEIIGMFVNMLAIRNRPNGNKNFREFLMEVKRSVIGVMENQDYYFEALVAELELQGNPSRNPLFDAVFAMNNVNFTLAAGTGADIPGGLPFTVEGFEAEGGVSRFDLLIAASEGPGGDIDNIMLEYSTDLFKPATAEKITSRYLAVLKQVVMNVDMVLKDIDISYGLLAADSSGLRNELGEFDF